jgi:nitroimidazol reductase NimA-like FMN-containing flavoprotein (pyridoxamine 5'-phosphate oxidase superfamily)
LLADHNVGRLAVVLEGQPVIFPVNYAVYGEHVVFRTDAGTKLFAAKDQRVAFEIDSADALYHEGWSVVVQGIAREETRAATLHILEQLPLRPWVTGPKAHWLSIGGGAITGRRVTHAL